MRSILQLAWRNVKFHRQAYLLTGLGVTLGTAILVGALVAADSLQHNLQRIALLRLGRVEHALISSDRFVRIKLAQELSDELSTHCAPVISLSAAAGSLENDRRITQTKVLGVDHRFWQLTSTAFRPGSLAGNEAIINSFLSQKLGLRPGDEFILRIEKKGWLPAELPLAREMVTTVPLRLVVKTILSEQQGGRFTLQNTQRAPYTVFLGLPLLEKELNLTEVCNTLLVGAAIDTAVLQAALERNWQLEDIGLTARRLTGTQQWEWTSHRIFIEEQIVEKVDGGQPIFTYLVNSLQSKDHATPYSFVSTANVLPLSMMPAAGQICLTRWLADDLDVIPRDSLTMTFFALDPGSKLLEASVKMQISGILPANILPDSTLMPQLPGLAGVDNCRDWHPGIPIDLKKIRKKDELYWQQHRGAPKAFISPETADTIWANRFGRLTTLRFSDSLSAASAAQKLKADFHLADLGLRFQPLKQQALQAANPTTDFSQLFIGLSFFVILAALLLIGLLFQLQMEARRDELTAYLALGFKRGQIQNLFLLEGAVVALAAILPGLVLGLLYVSLLLYGIKTWWLAAFSISDLSLHLTVASLALSGLAGFVLSILVILWRSKRLTALPPLGLAGQALPRQNKWWAFAAILFWSIGLAALLIKHPGSRDDTTLSFFMAGFFWLAGFFCFCRYWLTRPADNKAKLTVMRLALMNSRRRWGRSLAVITLWAAAFFLVLTIGANRKSLPDADDRHSGTGGFRLWMETMAPVVDDLNSNPARKQFSLTDSIGQKVHFFSMRLRPGEDASCLNLNRSQQPGILGVDARTLDSLDAFSFVRQVEGVSRPWQALLQHDDHVLPAIADQTVIQWGLTKAVGDTLDMIDEFGKSFKVRLIAGLTNSVFQGHLLISQTAFLSHYPSQPGFRIFLIDAPDEQASALINLLDLSFGDLGAEIITTTERLAQFNQVENTYLSIFLVLGGLALLLGSAGMGIIVSRNIHEARWELAALSAIGFTKSLIIRVLRLEHGLLFLSGCFIGCAAALLALTPLLTNPSAKGSLLTIVVIIAMILVVGWWWIHRALRWSLRQNLTAILKQDR